MQWSTGPRKFSPSSWPTGPPVTSRANSPEHARHASRCGGRRRRQLEQVAGTTQHAGQAPAFGKAEARAEQHVAGVEEAHGLVVNDGEAILLKITPPPIGVEQPHFGDGVAALSMPPRQGFGNA